MSASSDYLNQPQRSLDDVLRDRDKPPSLDRRSLLTRALAGAAIGATAALPVATAGAESAPDVFALGGRQDDDAAILSLFRQWLDTCRQIDGVADDISDDDPHRNALCDHLWDLEDRIFERRATAAGLGVKVFLHFYREFASWTPLTEQIKLGDEMGPNRAWVTSLFRDAAAAVPEVGECAAAIIHEDAELIAADMVIEWTVRYGGLDEPLRLYERPEWREEKRLRLIEKRELIAKTEAKTERGRAIKARHAGAAA